MEERDPVFAHVDQPAFEQMQIDHNISRIALFFVCILTVGVFYFTLSNFSLARILPFQQIEQVGTAVQQLNPVGSRSPVTSSRPAPGALGAGIAASGSPAASANASAKPSTSSAAASSAAASSAPSSSASAGSSDTYLVQSGDTLTGIAAKYKTNAQAIADLNQMTVNAQLRVGQTIKVPRG